MATFTDVLGGVTEDAGYKAPCRVATTADLGTSLIGLPVIDGIQIAANDRILVWKQADQTTNGIYVAASGAWSRAIDFSSSSSIMQGTQVVVAEGTSYTNTPFICLTDRPSVGTDNISFALLSLTPGNLAAAFSNLPTTLPALSGVLWNNGGSICIS